MRVVPVARPWLWMIVDIVTNVRVPSPLFYSPYIRISLFLSFVLSFSLFTLHPQPLIHYPSSSSSTFLGLQPSLLISCHIGPHICISVLLSFPAPVHYRYPHLIPSCRAPFHFLPGPFLLPRFPPSPLFTPLISS